MLPDYETTLATPTLARDLQTTSAITPAPFPRPLAPTASSFMGPLTVTRPLDLLPADPTLPDPGPIVPPLLPLPADAAALSVAAGIRGLDNAIGPGSILSHPPTNPACIDTPPPSAHPGPTATVPAATDSDAFTSADELAPMASEGTSFFGEQLHPGVTRALLDSMAAVDGESAFVPGSVSGGSDTFFGPRPPFSMELEGVVRAAQESSGGIQSGGGSSSLAGALGTGTAANWWHPEDIAGTKAVINSAPRPMTDAKAEEAENGCGKKVRLPPQRHTFQMPTPRMTPNTVSPVLYDVEEGSPVVLRGAGSVTPSESCGGSVTSAYGVLHSTELEAGLHEPSDLDCECASWGAAPLCPEDIRCVSTAAAVGSGAHEIEYGPLEGPPALLRGGAMEGSDGIEGSCPLPSPGGSDAAWGDLVTCHGWGSRTTRSHFPTAWPEDLGCPTGEWLAVLVAAIQWPEVLRRRQQHDAMVRFWCSWRPGRADACKVGWVPCNHQPCYIEECSMYLLHT
jgi:hypothetical protein